MRKVMPKAPAVILTMAALFLAGCGYNIIPPPPQDMPRVSGEKPLPLRVAVVSDDTGQLANILKQSDLFREVDQLKPNEKPDGFDAAMSLSYQDSSDHAGLGFVFPPCIIPFVDICIIPLGNVTYNLGASFQLTVTRPEGEKWPVFRTYAEKTSGVCQYLPFPGVFPFNLALIGPDTHCQQDGPQAVLQSGLAKIVGDLIADRSIFSGMPRYAPEAPAAQPGREEPAAAPSSAKPWWQQ